jgi:hypothetical protein
MLNWLKGLFVASLKRVAIYEVEVWGDKLQRDLREAVAKEGPGAIDRTIDAAQARLKAALETRGPTWAFLKPVRAKLAEAVQEFGDTLQAQVKKEVGSYGPTAVDLAFDKAQAALIARIEALAL